MLALGAQRLTAGRQKVHAGGVFEYFLRYIQRDSLFDGRIQTIRLARRLCSSVAAMSSDFDL